MADRKTLQSRKDLGPFRSLSRLRGAARLRGLQAGRHYNLHWLQSLRSGVRRVERYAVQRDDVRQHLSDDAGGRAGTSGI